MQNFSICVLEYGSGNTPAIKNMISYLGFDVSLISNPRELSSFDMMIIPGVGAFDNCIDLINDKDLKHSIYDFASSGKSFLGFALGCKS